MFSDDISDILPASDAFRSGTLEMSSSLSDLSGAAVSTPAIGLTASVMMLLCVVLIVISLSDFIKMLPLLLDSYTRKSSGLGLEHNLPTSRERNLAAFVLLLPFCLLADRFRFFTPRILVDNIPSEFMAPALVVVVFAYLLLRRVMFGVVREPHHLSFDARRALRRGIYNYFILAVVLVVVTIGVMLVCGSSDESIREVCLWEIAGAFGLSLLRSVNILKDFCSAFAIFLYLCALEFLPAGAMVAAALFL